ncbi:MAG: hypothetical protein GY724_19980 [Actinomycetia bacterium]|nr:hypothetical protein [Actinomycetes bacterium]MCP5033328.1 hypothetical protein [Actinomycetes bacterium]
MADSDGERSDQTPAHPPENAGGVHQPAGIRTGTIGASFASLATASILIPVRDDDSGLLAGQTGRP